MLMQTKRLAHKAFDPVTTNGSANDAGGDRKPKSSLRSLVGANKDRELRIGKPSRIFVDAIEVRFVVETLRRSERPGGCLQVRKSG